MRKLLEDKRGILPVLTLPMIIVLAILVLLIVVGVFVFTSINKYAVIGGGVIVLTLIFGLKGEGFNKTKAIFMGIIITGALVFILASGTLQTVFSVDKIQTSVEGGKVYWTVYASASDINEQYDFVKKLSAYEYPDGTTVTPKKSMAILITEKSSSCKYSIVDGSYGLRVLSIPSKDIELLVLDGNTGRSEILKGEKRDSVTIYDADGKGELLVTSEGLLGGENECPDYENVAIVEKDGKLIAVERDYLVNRRQDCLNLNWINCIRQYITNPPINTQFTSAFDSYQITSTQFTGNGLDLGKATFIIKADEDYFDSVIYTPPKDCKPIIKSINVADEITEESSSSIRVNIENREDSECKVTISLSSPDDLSFSPKSRELSLDSSATTTFTVSNDDELGSKRVDAEVCFISQYKGEVCDIESEFFDSIEKSFFNQPEEDCGDGVCQSFESYTTCPQDCEIPKECTADSDCKEGYECVDNECKRGEAQCEWYEQSYTKQTKDYGAFYWRAWTPAKPIIIETEECRIASWIYLVSGGIIILILGAFAILTMKPKKKRRKRK